MTKKERKALAVVLYTLGEIYCDDPKYGEVVARLADLLSGAEEEKEPNYVPTVPPDRFQSPWDWWEGLRQKTPMKPWDAPPYIGSPGDISPYYYGPSSEGISGQTSYITPREFPLNLCDSCDHGKKDKKKED